MGFDGRDTFVGTFFDGWSFMRVDGSKSAKESLTLI